MRIALEILTGLDNLHGKGFVHRDLKPDNILIMNGRFCLADFGISREIKTHSKATGTAGTMEYMPPEAFAKSPSVTPQTDIWAIGVILQRLLTGALPYPQEEQPSLIAAILVNDADEMPETVSSNLRSIVKKALQKNRENRFQTASEMREVLRDILKTPQKVVSNQAVLPAKTLLLEDSDKTAKLEIEPTQDWREIEAQKLKETKELKQLQKIEIQCQKDESLLLERERQKKQDERKIKKEMTTSKRLMLLWIIWSASVLTVFIGIWQYRSWANSNQLPKTLKLKPCYRAEKMGFCNENNKLIIPANYDNVGSFNEDIAGIAVEKKFEKEGSDAYANVWGFIDQFGKEIISVKYKPCDYPLHFSHGLACVAEYGERWNGQRYGFIDKLGNVVIPLKYDEAHSFSEDLALVRLDGKYSFIDKFGNIKLSLEYDNVYPFSEGLSLVATKTYLSTRKLNIPLAPKATDALNFIKVNSYSYKYYFVDKFGNKIIEVQESFVLDDFESWLVPSVNLFSEGVANVNPPAGKAYFIDKNGNKVISTNYDWAGSFSEGLACVRKKTDSIDRYGYIDKTGKEIIPLIYISCSNFKDGQAKVNLNRHATYDENNLFIDHNGNEIIANYE
ncbi:MAG TPA: WG repeat-containing protein [Pyrinomonadaceae bacterium]|nr:WG repeat-containing protein [Pyrinomonadaceae bacterium]